MEVIKEIWPFSPGHQELIFLAGGLAILGLMILNVAMALTQKLPLKTVLTSFFTEVGNATPLQKVLRVFFLIWLVATFFVLVTDILVNGNQIITVSN